MPHPNSDFAPIDLADVAVRELKALIESHINTLLTCDAAKHDHQTGIIKGLKTAQTRIEELARKWRANGDLDIVSDHPRMI
jgi:hypothetical protein